MSKLGRILVVEDESIIARDIAMQLCDLGYAVLGPASSGEQAIAMANSLMPDLVLMDVHLAGHMDGIDAAQLIRTQYAVPSLFLSAFDGPDSLRRAKQCEPAGYLVKPFEDHQLRDAVATAFASLG
ncbi:response regulator [Roseateles oligotrophus]|uniref:Response regulator n=1 Tax=Roseateles oligotrophus TaxID=1769250 RepID=A0ABT2YFX0_9BURK|nr:response regulator [Roseateles oligotrophus]MCV2368919.1 response regulator [Roseateles oligotrophus]